MNRLLSALALSLLVQPFLAEAGTFQYKVYARDLRTPAIFQTLNAPATAQTFPAATVGNYAASDIQFAFQNTGGLAGRLPVPALAGANPGDFSASSNCDAVAASGTCVVTVRFKPTATGTRTASLTLNGVTYMFSGTANAGFGGNWATGTSGAMGTIENLTTTSKRFQLAKTTGTGVMSVGFVMTGDTSQFQFTAVGTSLSGGWTCASGGTISADKTSIAYCTARDTSGALANIEFDVRYAPTSVGDHAITVTPITNNGTSLPAPLAVTGSSRFNPTAVWVSGTSGAYGNLAVNSVSTKRLTLNNTGSYGALALGFTLSGDVSQFKIVRMGRSLSGGWWCVSGGVVAADKLSVTPCYAGGSGALSNLEIEVSYAPVSSGSHTVTLTPNSPNGTVLPTPLTLTGTAP